VRYFGVEALRAAIDRAIDLARFARPHRGQRSSSC
jgi:hypothetical protein